MRSGLNQLRVMMALALMGCAALAGALSAVPSAHGRASEKTSELLRVTGLEKAFEGMGDLVRSGLRDLPAEAHKDGFAAAADAAAIEVFSKGALLRKLSERIDGKLSDDDVDAVIKFYGEPLGKHMVELETEAGSAQAETEMLAMSKDLIAQLKDDKPRAAVIDRLITSLKLNDLMTNMALGMQRAMRVAMLAGSGQKVEMAQINAQVEGERAKTAEQMQQMTLLAMAYTYRKASVEELENYVAFLSGPVGTRLYDVIGPAVSDTLVDTAGKYGEVIIAKLK